MSKLIDVYALTASIWERFPNNSHRDDLSVAIVIEKLIRDQPDASEPLRARIAELEEVLSTVREWISLRSPSPVQSIIAESIDKALAKGAQDA